MKLELIRFHASWCNPCKLLAPIIEQVDKEMTDLTVIHCDVDADPTNAAKYGIMSIPTIVLLKDGEIVQRMSGYQPKERIVAMINSQR
jgi:thioredoxin 1